MARDLTKKKHDDLRNDYMRWAAKKYKGTRMYTDSYIFKKLSEKYYLSSSTIENILYSRI